MQGAWKLGEKPNASIRSILLAELSRDSLASYIGVSSPLTQSGTPSDCSRRASLTTTASEVLLWLTPP